MHGFLITLLAWGTAGFLGAQTAWTLHPGAPSNLTSIAKLKYANNSARLVWQSSSFYPMEVYQTDLAAAPDIPTPYYLPVSPNTMGVDPAPGSFKRLTIRYATSTGEYQSIVQDGSTLYIPGSSRTLVGPPQTVNGFVVVSATYGTTTLFADVKSVFRTTKIPLPSSSYDFTLSDFTCDASGELLLLGGGYSPSVAFPYYNDEYRIAGPSGSYVSYSSGTKTCGALGNGWLVMGFSSPSYSLSDD